MALYVNMNAMIRVLHFLKDNSHVTIRSCVTVDFPNINETNKIQIQNNNNLDHIKCCPMLDLNTQHLSALASGVVTLYAMRYTPVSFFHSRF